MLAYTKKDMQTEDVVVKRRNQSLNKKRSATLNNRAAEIETTQRNFVKGQAKHVYCTLPLCKTACVLTFS